MSDPPSAVPDPQPRPAAGWYSDPLGRYAYRYFDGAAWTSMVGDGGAQFNDPLGVAPSHVTAPLPQRGNGIAAAAMICGILGVLTAWIPILVVVGVVLAVLGIVFGVKGRRRAKEVGSGDGFAITGIATGIAALLLSIVGIVLTVVLFRTVEEFVDVGPVEGQITECTNDDGRFTVAGTVTNQSRDTRNYTVFIELTPSDRLSGRTFTVEVNDVEPGASAAFEVTASGVDNDYECSVHEIRGPLPFDIGIGVALDE